MLNDRQLRYAHAVWKERSFSRAAAKLNVTQPALSDQVRRLEEELGFALFYRNARGVEPSIAGKTFLEASEAIVHGLTDLASLAKELRGQPGQVIRIGLNSGLSQAIIPRLTRILGETSNTRIEFVTATNRRIQRLLHQQRLDFGFLFDSEIKGSTFKLSWTPIGRSQMVVLHPVGHRFASSPTGVELTDLAQERLIFSEPRVGYEAVVREALAAQDLTPKVAADCDDIESLKYIVQSGGGLAVVPRIVAARELSDELIGAAPLLPPAWVEINFVRRPEPLAAKVEQAAAKVVKSMKADDDASPL